MKNVSCISIYANAQSCRLAINKLQQTMGKLHNISIISQKKSCDGVTDLLANTNLFEVPGIGQLLVAENLLSLTLNTTPDILPDILPHINQKNLKTSDNYTDLSLNKNQIEILLINIGVPTKNISDYQQAVKDNKMLLLFYGEQNQVEQASELMHTDSQQVTVHRV